MNYVRLLGKCAQDVQLRETQGRATVANVNIGVRDEGQPRTEWFRLVFWGEMARQAKLFHQGDLISVEGRFQTRKWTDDKGIERYTTEVVVSKILG